MITGSGSQNRDEELLNIKLVIANDFAKKESLRYDLTIVE
jgi:hypothetical protein